MKNIFKKFFGKKESKNSVLKQQVSYRVKCKVYSSHDNVFIFSYVTSTKPEDKWEYYGTIRDWFMEETTKCYLAKTENTDVILYRDLIKYIELHVEELYE